MQERTLDLDLPLHACFLGAEGSAERSRWETLLTAYGATTLAPAVLGRGNGVASRAVAATAG